MPSVPVRSVTGSSVGAVRLDDSIFGVEPNVPVMHQVVTAQLAAARSGTQSTKTRAEVRGGGRKPWRQKGSGRARQGSNRAPHWTGGGVALGPKPRSYRQRTPKKMIQLALHSALSDRAAEQRIVVVDSWGFEAPKTKDAKDALTALGVSGGKVLIVLGAEDEVVGKSFRNLPDVSLLLASELNAYDVLCSDWVIFTRATVPGVTTDTAEAPTTETEEPPAPGTETPPAPAPAGEIDWDAPIRADSEESR
jgi:large subunit ribosomal protein L4